MWLHNIHIYIIFCYVKNYEKCPTITLFFIPGLAKKHFQLTIIRKAYFIINIAAIFLSINKSINRLTNKFLSSNKKNALPLQYLIWRALVSTRHTRWPENLFNTWLTLWNLHPFCSLRSGSWLRLKCLCYVNCDASDTTNLVMRCQWWTVTSFM